MWFRSTHGFRKSRSARTPARRRRPSAARLACEVLESRCLLSYTITDLGGLAQAFPMNFGYAVNNHSQVAGRSNFPGGSSAAAMWDNGAITQLTPRGGTAYGINDQTQVVGDFPVSGTSHAFLWQAGVLTDLGTPPGNGSSQGVRINNVGQIAVSANSGNHAYLWQGGIWTNLGTLGGGSSNPGGINDQGQVVGTSVTASGAYHAFLWQGGVMSDLGTLGGASGASAINNQGQVVGNYYVSGNARHAFLWQNGVMTDLGTLGGSFSTALGINDQGQVVGSSTTASGAQHAFLWDHGAMTDLGIPPGYESAQGAFGINDQGQVLVSFISDPGAAFLWQAGVWTALGGTLSGYSNSFAVGINNQSQVVGYSYVSPSTRHAVLWQAGATTDLGTLGGSDSVAVGINDQGQVVGSLATGSGVHAFLWQNGVMSDLGTLGGSESLAYGINNQGQVVGISSTATGTIHAFLWENGVMTDLGTLGGFSSAAGINNLEQIVGSSALSTGGPFHGFLWDGAHGMQDLGTLAGDSESSAFGINDVGQAIGVSSATVGYIDAYFDPETGDCYEFQNFADFPHAVLWHNGSLMSIGALAGTNDGRASAVNNVGQVIGYSFSSALLPSDICPGTVAYVASNYHWFLWQDGVTIDLGAMLPPGSGWTIQSVSGINDAGEIIGYGRNPQGQTHAFVLTPDGSPSPRRGFDWRSLSKVAFHPAIAMSVPNDDTVVAEPAAASSRTSTIREVSAATGYQPAAAIPEPATRRDRSFTAGMAVDDLTDLVALDLLGERIFTLV